MGEDYILIPRDKSVPGEADFAFVMDSDNMEPLIKNGARVYISRRLAPGQMEPGLFYLDGRVLCRLYCEDYGGNVHLLCANPEREGENISLPKGAAGLKCLGKVLTKGKAAAPLYL